MIHDRRVRVARARETGGPTRVHVWVLGPERPKGPVGLLPAPAQTFRLSLLPFSHLEKKVQKLESQQRGELESMREEKSRLQVPCTNGTGLPPRVRAGAQVSCDCFVSSLWSGTRWQPSGLWSCS